MRKGVVLLTLAGVSFGGVLEDIQKILEPSRNREKAVEQRVLNEIERRLDTPVSVNVKDVSLEYLFSVLSNQVKLPIVFYNFQATEQRDGVTGGVTEQQRDKALLGQVTYYAENKPFRYVLDELTALYDLHWFVDRGRVYVYRYVEDVFHVRLPWLMKTLDIDAEFLKLQYQKKLVENLERSLQTFLKDSNSKVAINEMGYVTVRGRPSEVRAIKKVVEEANKYFSTQIPLRVRVVVTAIRDDKAMGLNIFNFDARFRDSSSRFTGSFNVGGPASGLTLGILRPSFDATLKALQDVGDTKIVEDYYLRALNYQPISYTPQTKKRIVSKVNYETTATQEGGAITSVVTPETEDLSTGTMLVLVPYVIDEKSGEIAVEFYRKQTEVLDLKEEEFKIGTTEGGEVSNKIVLPTIDNYMLFNQIVLKPGESLVLFSGTMTREEIKKRGVPFLVNIPILGMLFGTHEKKNDKFLVTVVMTYEK